MSLLRLDQVELHFGTHVILDKISLNLEAGDRLGLLGPQRRRQVYAV